jgi:myo-inositol-1(or 4)-monophosphatase
MTDSLSFAVQLARQAGDILEEYFSSRSLSTRLKSDDSVVTDADLASDHWITRQITTQFPGNLILSEELQPDYLVNDPNNLAAVWVIDPLDGTTNFSLGLPIWGVCITRVVEGWPQETVQFFPRTNELYSAKSGEGAWLNDSPIHVDQSNQTSTFFSCCSRTYQRYQISIPYKTRIMGSAAYSFCCVARGAAIIGFEAAPKIWDIAGAWLLIQEAGGVIETLDGSLPFPLQSAVDYRNQNFPTLAAPNPRLLKNSYQKILLKP